MAIVEERPILEAQEPLHGFCRNIVSVRTHWVVALFRDPSPLGASGLFTGRAQAELRPANSHLGNRQFQNICKTPIALDLRNCNSSSEFKHARCILQPAAHVASHICR
jgi:hypothetical protein